MYSFCKVRPCVRKWQSCSVNHQRCDLRQLPMSHAKIVQCESVKAGYHFPVLRKNSDLMSELALFPYYFLRTSSCEMELSAILVLKSCSVLPPVTNSLCNMNTAVTECSLRLCSVKTTKIQPLWKSCIVNSALAECPCYTARINVRAPVENSPIITPVYWALLSG